ncbi:EmrB/QacA subfamily drug resistance transporter [Tamaricihabitans halophyticus]|uniref:EmrB/QacA subfamily drug resistance transporter n=1 Tax=Tamaricihabitans halophyticus TaxID=1262583 RepID=A0A4R2QDN1_9PSEU|nr:DHA2 family efflux MFS transporter permease subunit [Tamaricihabitans halophyticus]TCP45111.1 EmrB/QacA subfamily drug resistance transporter [Tamaricihabitans halophyticus]
MNRAASATSNVPLLRVALILVLGTFMATLDATIVSVGIDTLAGDFDATVTEIQWVSTAYLLAIVAVVPASGWLADRFGGRRVWLLAIALFLLGSLLCALAWSLPSLVVFRVVQGLGGGLLPPTGQALLARIAGPDRTGRLLSIVAVVPLLSPVLGPLLGGSILSIADWPWLFYVNLPIGLLTIVLARRYVPVVPAAGQRARFDLRGAMLLTPGLAVLVFGLTEISHGRAGIPVLLVGLAMLVAFVVHGVRTKHSPLIDPRLFVRQPFGSVAIALFLLGASVFGAMFLLPLYFQTGPGLSALQAGMLLAPQGVGAALGSVLVHRAIDRVAARTLVCTGIILVVVGTVVFTQLVHDPPVALVALSLLVRGVGAAMISAPVMNVVYSRIDPELLPRAAGALNLLNTVGGSVGTAALAALLQARLAARDSAVAAAFADTFWWVVGFGLLAVLAGLRLPARARTSTAN